MNEEVFDTTYQEEVYQIRLKPIVVINEAWDQLGEKERELLSKIISALKISADSVTIVAQPLLDITYFNGRTLRLIYFGDLPEGVSRYEILESHDLSFICSVSLTQLLENEQARKQLWAALKKLFSV
jgi:DNA polymerase III psi subunit